MAVGADSTGIRVTWTHADFVATDLITGAIVVARAARAGNPWPIHFRGIALDAGIALEADHHVGSWKIGAEVGVVAVQLRVSSVASDALALGPVIHRIAEGIHAAHLGQAGILAGLGIQVAEAVIGALFVARALWRLLRLAFATGSQTVAQLNGTSAATTFVDHHATLQGAHTVTALIDAEALLLSARGAVFVDIQSGSRWADTLSIHIPDEALLDDAQRALVALHGWVSGVSLQALADHGPHGQSIPDAAESVHSTWLGGIAGIHTFTTQASLLAGTIRIADADGHVALRFAAIPSGHGSWWASALRSVLVYLAYFILGTDRSCCTNIIAFTIHTRPVRRAFVIGSASQRGTRNPGVSSMSWDTLAYSTMFNGQALGIGSTLLTLAGRDAELIAALVGSRTVGIDTALDLGALKLWVTLESLTTRADGLVILDAALGIQAAVAGISADAVQTGLIRRTV